MNEIEQIRNILKEVGFKVFSDNTSIYENLIFSEDDAGKLKIPISIMLFPQDDTNDMTTSYIQFYFEYSVLSDNLKHKNISNLLQEKNTKVPYGCFNILDDKIYFKYIMICNNKIVDKAILYDILNTFIYVIENLTNDA